MATTPVARSVRSGAPDPSAVRRWVERTCAEQGVPIHITDPRTLTRLWVLFGMPGGGPTRNGGRTMRPAILRAAEAVVTAASITGGTPGPAPSRTHVVSDRPCVCVSDATRVVSSMSDARHDESASRAAARTGTGEADLRVGMVRQPDQVVLLLTLTAPGDGLSTGADGEGVRVHPRRWDQRGGVELDRRAPVQRCHDLPAALVRGAYAGRRNPRRQTTRPTVQDAGALHFHVLLRVGTSTCAPRGLPEERIRTAGYATLVIERGFGHEVDLQLAHPRRRLVLRQVRQQDRRRAHQLAVARPRTGEITTGNDRYRPWSASQRWGLTMAQVRAAQAAWASQNGPASPEPSGAPQPTLAAAEAPEAPRRGAALDRNTHRYTTHPPGQIGCRAQMGTSADG